MRPGIPASGLSRLAVGSANKADATTEGSDPASVEVMKDLQAFAGVDLVVPVGEEHMYQAAMSSKSCKLTALGNRYWGLVKHKRL